MRFGFLAPVAGFSLVAALVEPAFAQDAAPAASAPAAPAGSPATTPAAPAAPRAPAGPSPYAELVTKGDGAYLGRDFDGAIAAYRDEIARNASSAVAHYRLGQAQLAKGELKEAEQSWQSALRFAGKDEALRGKVLFVLADLQERLKVYDDATKRWQEYAAHAEAKAEARSYPASAAERIKRIEEWKKISADAALVKERIEKRVKEAEESLRKSSK